jgi:hypothetical protein
VWPDTVEFLLHLCFYLIRRQSTGFLQLFRVPTRCPFSARFAWSDAASLLIRNFCIPPANFLISLCFGFGCVARVPPGVVGVVGVVGVLGGVLGGVVVVACVDGSPLTVVSGDTVVVAAGLWPCL